MFRTARRGISTTKLTFQLYIYFIAANDSSTSILAWAVWIDVSVVIMLLMDGIMVYVVVMTGVSGNYCMDIYLDILNSMMNIQFSYINAEASNIGPKSSHNILLHAENSYIEFINS